MTSSQDRDGPSGQPTASKPDDTPSSPTSKDNKASILALPPPSTPLEELATRADKQKDGTSPQSLAQAQASTLDDPNNQHKKAQDPKQDVRANLQTPPRPLQHQHVPETPTHDTNTPANMADMAGNDTLMAAPPQDRQFNPFLLAYQPSFINAWLSGQPNYPLLPSTAAPASTLLSTAPLYPDPSQSSQNPQGDEAIWDLPMPLGFLPNGDHTGNLASGDEDADEETYNGYAADVKPYGHLEFSDSTFWITTHNVLIGRDQAAYWQAKKWRHRGRKLDWNTGPAIHSPDRPLASYQAYTKSYISEEGGLLGPESEEEGNSRPTKRRKTNAGRQVHTAKQQQKVISSRQYLDHTPGAALVNVQQLRPSDDFVARVSIHGKAPEVVENTKGISRDHAKIQYNSRTRIWEIAVLGRNGIFHNDVHHDKDEVLTLRSGDGLQIQSVCFRFWLTGIENGMTGAEEESAFDAPVSKTYSQGGKEMSFEFQSRDDGDRETSSSSVISGEIPLVARLESHQSEVSEDKDMDDASDLQTPSRDDDNDNDRDADEILETVEHDSLDENRKKSLSADDTGRLDQLPMPPKKRGPGRPPKNGVMSKREERLLKKMAQEEAKKNAPPQEPGEQPLKRKVGRPRKHPRPEDESELPEKRKYKPRKPKGEEGEDDADGEKPSKERSQKAKTPPLELKREDYDPDQLQKPAKNYQLLIDEIMVDAPPNGYSLKQIYKRIQKKWPYFYFSVDTKGWESSVRHNLLGSDCFKKIDGHWHRVPGVPLESGKKQRKPSPIVSPRPAGMYNGGYGHHPYQPPSHPQHLGHQPIAHNTGLSQPNLPPRYPPNGQAYQIAQGPPPRPGQPGVTPGHQPPVRPGFPQPQAPPAAPQAHAYANANASSRPQYTANQAPHYNPAFGNRPPAPAGANQGAAGPSAAQVPMQNSAQRPPPTRPGQAPPSMPQQGFPPAQAHAQPNIQRVTPAPHRQPSLPNSAPPAPLGPVIDPILRDFIKDFKTEVIKQLQAREGKKSEAVAMSVINRGLGLADRSLTPECAQYEKLILDIFVQHKATFPAVLASKRRAQEASRAASTTPASSIPATAPPLHGNKSIAGALPRTDGVATASAMPAAKSTSGLTGSDTSMNIGTNEQANASSAAETTADRDTKVGESATTKQSLAAAVPSRNTPVATAPSVPAPPVPTPEVRPAAAPAAAKTSNALAPSVSANTDTPTPAVTPTNSAPAISGTPVSDAKKAVAGSNVPAASANASPSTHPNGSAGAATGATGPSTVAAPKPADVNSTSNASTTATSASTLKAAAVTAVPSMAASAGPRGATSGPSAGPAVSASPSPAPNRSRAVSTPGASTPADDKKDVELLDPKLVALIMNFKKTILPTLVERLGLLLGESIFLSAVDQLLGFTDESFVQAKNDQQKQHFQEAEKALMMHLETRFKDYVKNRVPSK